MYAVFQVSGFQYRAEEGQVLQIPLQKVGQGESLDLTDVLLVQDKDAATVGTPFVEGASIKAEVLRHGKGEKVEIYKYKRRTKYRRRQGHRQDFTEIKINKIVTP
ncbi:MAG: 50S ribosomal protein L21 [candidate division Zixibacteria bacterium]|jgi:large subunit ribosomal protein L21|nr:50S ribosomal protein L21 [candidate division Zixibacteria bacterium]